MRREKGMVWMILTGVLVSLAMVPPMRPPEIVFPQDPEAVIDAKRDLGAKGDGKHDDTEALQRGIWLSSGHDGPRTKILYLPNGVYRITRPLIVNRQGDRSGVGPWIYGQSRDKVIIRLDDGVNAEAVLRTHPNDKPGSSDWFMRTIYNLTVDVGNNPETDGIRYFSNNTGILKWVRVTGRGKVGINSFMQLNGPNLIQDTIVDGSFEVGILSEWQWGQTLSRVTIRNCRRVGLEVRANSVAAEDLVIENTPVGIINDIPQDWHWWGGVIAILGGRFVKGNPNNPAIDNESVLYVRNLQVSGYKMAIKSTTPSGDVVGPFVAEYVSHPVRRLFEQAPSKALHLPIKREPVVPWERNPTNWVCANDFGAVYGDNEDDTEAIQKAIDFAAANRKTVVYLRGIGRHDPNWYTLDGEVRVHGTVRHIIGMGFGRIVGKGKFIVDDQSAPVVKFENLQAFGGLPPVVENRSRNRTVVLENCDLRVLGTGQGDIFMTNCPSHIELRSKGQSLWARQLNPEGNSDVGLVVNEGGNLWILGMKNEGRGVRIRTANGGKTEVFGVFNYGPGIPPEDQRPMFDIDNASFCVAGIREIAFGGPTFHVKVRERRGDEVREYRLKPGEHGWIGWALFSGW